MNKENREKFWSSRTIDFLMEIIKHRNNDPYPKIHEAYQYKGLSFLEDGSGILIDRKGNKFQIKNGDLVKIQ